MIHSLKHDLSHSSLKFHLIRINVKGIFQFFFSLQAELCSLTITAKQTIHSLELARTLTLKENKRVAFMGLLFPKTIIQALRDETRPRFLLVGKVTNTKENSF